MERAQIIDRLWEESPLFLTREQFEQTLLGWKLEVVHGPSGVAGVVVSKGAEFHFSKWDASFPIGRDILRRWPGELIAKYGYALTRTPKEDTRQRRFNERLGFEAVGEDQFDIHYRITRLRVKETSCRS
jgi:hypothetical protein